MTHQVSNQAADFSGRNLGESDPFLQQTVRQYGAKNYLESLEKLKMNHETSRGGFSMGKNHEMKLAFLRS